MHIYFSMVACEVSCTYDTFYHVLIKSSHLGVMCNIFWNVVDVLIVPFYYYYIKLQRVNVYLNFWLLIITNWICIIFRIFLLLLLIECLCWQKPDIRAIKYVKKMTDLFTKLFFNCFITYPMLWIVKLFTISRPITITSTVIPEVWW